EGQPQGLPGLRGRAFRGDRFDQQGSQGGGGDLQADEQDGRVDRRAAEGDQGSASGVHAHPAQDPGHRPVHAQDRPYQDQAGEVGRTLLPEPPWQTRQLSERPRSSRYGASRSSTRRATTSSPPPTGSVSRSRGRTDS